MDPTKLLEADHRMVESTFDEISRAEGEARAPLVEQLATALRGHFDLEEEVVYPAMAPATGAEAVEEAGVEHRLSRKSLDQLLELAPDQPGFGAALEALKAGIMHHVQEEEQEVFPKLRQDGALLDRLATPLVQKRQQLGMPMDAAALAASSSKDELRAEAAGAGVEGTSSMTKQELADAIVSRMR